MNAAVEGRMHLVALKSFRCFATVLPLLFASATPSVAQDSQLRGLTGVRVVVTWTGGADSDKDALQSDVELRLRQAGMRVLTADEQALAPGRPMLIVGVGGPGAATPVAVTLSEAVTLERENLVASAWLVARLKQPNPITDEEYSEHSVQRMATTWQRFGVAQNTQTESVKQIIARYANHPYWQTPAGRPIVQHMMDLEVQAAMAEAQRPANPGTVRDTVKGYVDTFLNDWLAANPKQR
jgi:hypothetical protein